MDKRLEQTLCYSGWHEKCTKRCSHHWPRGECTLKSRSDAAAHTRAAKYFANDNTTKCWPGYGVSRAYVLVVGVQNGTATLEDSYLE